MDPRTFGYQLELATRREAWKPVRNPGEFNFRSFLRQNDVDVAVECNSAQVTILQQTSGFFLAELALTTKRHFLITYRNTIRAPASRLIAAATLGVRKAVDKVDYRGHDITEMFRHAGVGHVLAVSGRVS